MNDIELLIKLTGNKRLSHLEEEIFANKNLIYMYLSALHNTEIDKNHVLYYAYRYAKDVIKGRWPEAEAAIKTDSQLWKSYCKEFSYECNTI